MTCLLLISCSARKSMVSGMIPAIERYTGVVYQVLHKARREGYWPEGWHLAIVSARHGLIGETVPIEWYDLKMTRARAQAMQTEVSASLDALLQSDSYTAVFLVLGMKYRLAVQFSVELERLRQAGKVNEAKGGLGEQLHQLCQWLQTHAH